MSREYDLGYLFARERAKGAGVADLDAHLGDMQREAPESKRCVNMLDGKGNRCFGSVLVVKEPEEEPKPGEKRKKQKLWCPKCLGKKAEENKSEAGQQHSATYRDANREELNEKNADRKEERRNDPELHAHDQQVAAEYRAQPEHKDRMAKDNAQAGPRKAMYKLTDKGVASEERYRRSAAKRASRLRERENGKKLESNARYRANHRAELKTKKKIWNASPMGLLTRALYKMVKGVHWDPQSFTKLGSFASNEEAMAHFEARFDPSWMSWENQGRHVKGNAYNATWNIGHALPRKIFDESDEEDLRRCWHPDNLFPQCARQNTELRDALIYTDDELLEMRHLWPMGANDDLAQLKGLFQFVDHDFINAKMAAEAGPSGLNDGFVSDDASSESG